MARQTRLPKAKCWTFRYYCYPENVEELLFERKETFQYLVAAKYKDETGRDNLAGYITFSCQKRQKHVEMCLDVEARPDRVDTRIARGSSKKNKAYLKQKGQCFEIGENSLKNREKGNMEEMWERRKQKANEGAMLEEFGESWLHAQGTIDNSIKRQEAEEAKERLCEKFKGAILRPWQSRVLVLLRSQGPRRITFIVDEDGNTGKTFLAKYLIATKEALYFTSASPRDVAFASTSLAN